jgi:hypothetical protein
VSFPSNPEGRGFYLTEESAENQPLPNLEWHDEQLRAWDHRPDPGCLAPCPDQPFLRVELSEFAEERFADRVAPQALRTIHVGHGRCIFGELQPGAQIEVLGMASRHTRFEVPAPPVSVSVRRRGKQFAIRPRLRAVMIADRGSADLVWGAALTWPAHTLGGEMRVDRAAEARMLA